MQGVPSSLVHAAGPWAFVVALLLAAQVAAAFAPARWRGRALLAAGVATLVALSFAAGYAARTMVPGTTSIARVSVGGGAWLAAAGAGIVWYQGALQARRAESLVALACAVAGLAGALLLGGVNQLSLADEYRTESAAFWPLFADHVELTLAGTTLGALIGIPLGIAAARWRAVRASAIPAAGVIQTIPALAMFGLLILPLTALGLPTVGTLPALIALTLYALLPIIRNTYLGLAAVDSAVVDAGRGMGMSRRQLLLRVELPLALPLLLDGLRIALVLTVGLVAVMAIGGAQNLGTLIFLGWGQQADDLTLLGAVPMVILAIAADQAMRAIERRAVSAGIRPGGEAA